ncbi:hypothetical protein HOLleu_04133 [Holothuria leucospilota]|uniref:Uncharacterized protein n=1 Tax=Holothuria leucospilota TaxID=206669 RepID=A0A9Q1CTG8_HOLLE|nr:hypothetical protein HOLleu_04133 [Holothuria leucospilota]
MPNSLSGLKATEQAMASCLRVGTSQSLVTTILPRGSSGSSTNGALSSHIYLR